MQQHQLETPKVERVFPSFEFVSIEIQMHSEGSSWLLFARSVHWVSQHALHIRLAGVVLLHLACLCRSARAEVLLTASVLACAPAPTPQDFKVFVQLTVSAISYGLYLWLLFAICLFN